MQLERYCFIRAYNTVAVNFVIYGETISKSWVRINKETRPRDMIVALRPHIDQGEGLERWSKAMFNLIKEYYVSLQGSDYPINSEVHST